MDLPQLCSLLDTDDPPLADPSFPFDILNAAVEDSDDDDDDDALSDDGSMSSLPVAKSASLMWFCLILRTNISVSFRAQRMPLLLPLILCQ